MATSSEATPEHFEMIAELGTQLLVDIHSIAKSLEFMATTNDQRLNLELNR